MQRIWKIIEKVTMNQHEWYGDLQSEDANTLCQRIAKYDKIPNLITDEPTFIFPYQASFASKYGYIPKGHLYQKEQKEKVNRLQNFRIRQFRDKKI